MATARDQLIIEVEKLFVQALPKDAAAQIFQVLDQFRIQAKPKTVLHAQTAREALCNGLVALWSVESKSRPSDTRELVDRYRMQTKQGAHQVKPRQTGTSKKTKVNSKEAPRSEATHPISAHSEPLAGGPQKRSKARGECPKCHSMGVVLARSYAGDEYFSCIYCGFQAYVKNIDTELDLPLAAELLGRRFDDSDGQEN